MRLLPEGVLAPVWRARSSSMRRSRECDYGVTSTCLDGTSRHSPMLITPPPMRCQRAASGGRRRLALLLVLGRELDRLVRKRALRNCCTCAVASANGWSRGCRSSSSAAGAGALEARWRECVPGDHPAAWRAFMRAIDACSTAMPSRLQDPNSWSR